MRSAAKTLVWLASYPKSGNTWARAFFANYLLSQGAPVDINQIGKVCPSDQRPQRYRQFGGPNLDMSDLSAVLPIRQRVLADISSGGANAYFLKTHSANRTIGGLPTIPPQLTLAAFLIIRDPRDTVVSLAYHNDWTFDFTIDFLAQPDAIARDRTGVQPAIFLGDWSRYYTDWSADQTLKPTVLRYEDLLEDPAKNFTRALARLGIPSDADRLARAVEFASFKTLSGQEEAHGFQEISTEQERFFRGGRAGDGKRELSRHQLRRIEKNHEAAMKAFGYL